MPELFEERHESAATNFTITGVGSLRDFYRFLSLCMCYKNVVQGKKQLRVQIYDLFVYLDNIQLQIKKLTRYCKSAPLTHKHTHKLTRNHSFLCQTHTLRDVFFNSLRHIPTRTHAAATHWLPF